MQTPLVDKIFLLEKFQGKGGWTFVRVPEIAPDPHTHFGWVRVRGYIDDYEIKGYHLQPMGNGHLFLPVKAEIRKKIRKQSGDSVHIILYKDNLPTEIPEELRLCLSDEPVVYEIFMTFSESQKKSITDWIYSAKTEQTKADRIAATINDIIVKNQA